MNAKGTRALVDRLRRDLAERPRSYVKAWYANYLLYGAELGVKDVSDPARGFALAEEARAEGSLFALELVGRAWGDGRGTPRRDTAKAVELLTEAAAHDRDSAMSELGKFYFFGDGVPVADRARAEQWMRIAAYRGATGGLYGLASWWENPTYTPQPDHAKALALYYTVGELGSVSARRLIDERAKKGDPLAQKYVHLRVVESALIGGDPLPSRLRAAAKWLESHAAADDWPVQLALAEAMTQRELPLFDLAGARAKLARAIAAQQDDAQALHAELLWEGIGQKADPTAAIALWRELAAKGNPRALNKLGWLHWWGNGERHGVPKNAELAFSLCKQAAMSGYWAAQLNLADCYTHAIGTETNYFLAAKYYDVLEKRGYVRGREMKHRILALVKD